MCLILVVSRYTEKKICRTFISLFMISLGEQALLTMLIFCLCNGSSSLVWASGNMHSLLFSIFMILMSSEIYQNLSCFNFLWKLRGIIYRKDALSLEKLSSCPCIVLSQPYRSSHNHDFSRETTYRATTQTPFLHLLLLPNSFSKCLIPDCSGMLF